MRKFKVGTRFELNGTVWVVTKIEDSQIYYNYENESHRVKYSYHDYFHENAFIATRYVKIIDHPIVEKQKINSEFIFSKQTEGGKIAKLTLYLYYDLKKYDICQDHEEGLNISYNNEDTELNRAYFELGLEILNFVDSEIYGR
jgi:hypothetical protein